MKIKKLGHCCFIVEPKEGIKIMTDPGAYSTLQNEEVGITAVLITHEHGDHLHIESVKKILENNPNITIITNSAVGKILEKENIKYTKVEDTQNILIEGISITGFGNEHSEIYGDYGRVQNTGYMIESLCFPGDSFNLPNSKVDILALPIAGPWMQMKEAVEYAKQLKPRVIFPVHDVFLQDYAPHWRISEHFINEIGIVYKKLEIGKEEEV